MKLTIKLNKTLKFKNQKKQVKLDKRKMVLIDKEKCIGCGVCAAICEVVFEMKDGKATVKAGKKNSKDACVKEAADSCPVQAIKF